MTLIPLMALKNSGISYHPIITHFTKTKNSSSPHNSKIVLNSRVPSYTEKLLLLISKDCVPFL